MRDGTPAAWQPVDPAKALSEDDIPRLVHAFYGKIRDHGELGPIFERELGGDWEPHLDKMVRFWATMVIGDQGERAYDGRPLPAHLALPDLRDHHFSQWLVLFRETVGELFPPPVAGLFIERAERMAQSFRYAIAVHTGRPLP
jgi:hemoglobin